VLPDVLGRVTDQAHPDLPRYPGPHQSNDRAVPQRFECNPIFLAPADPRTLSADLDELPGVLEATVVAWCASSATYLVMQFMRAAPCYGCPRIFVNSMVAAWGALSTCVRRMQMGSEVKAGL
jgi:hypothetical protein